MSYKVRLEVFEGPLDLLLYLIKKSELDICDISVSRVADQYFEYIRLMEFLDLEFAGEFLVTAATLMLIKSRSLLPEEETLQEEDEEDSGKLLLENLLEYRKYKKVAEILGNREYEQHNVFTRSGEEPEIETHLDAGLFDLLGAFSQIMGDFAGEEEVASISQDGVTVEQQMRFVMDIASRKSFVSFAELFTSCKSKYEAVATFLAMLELIRLQEIKVKQEARFGSIVLFRSYEKKTATGTQANNWTRSD